MEGEIKTLKSDIEKESWNYIMLAAAMTSITERVDKLEEFDKDSNSIVKQIAEIEQGLEDNKQQIKTRIQTTAHHNLRSTLVHPPFAKGPDKGNP